MPEPLLEEVFKISGVPTYTFVEPSQFGELKVGLRSHGRGLVVEGPSGIGKSTAVARALSEIGQVGGATTLSARNPADIGYIELLPEITDFGLVIVDDFHVLDDSIRSDLADLLKRLADTESRTSKLIVIGINRAGDSLIEHAPDLANRIDTIRFEVEPADKVRALVAAGEKALNITLDASDKVVEGAQGSFYLAQLLGHALCTEAGVTEALATRRQVTTSYATVRRKVMERQERRFGKPIMTFVRGPRFRTSGRANYLHILSWLKDAESWSISLPEEMARHANEKASVGQVVEKGYLQKLTATSEIAQLLHFDPTTKILSVEDPQLVFYLRNLDWPGFIGRTGFTRVDVSKEYDFALSFAGEDRQFAEQLFDHLVDCDISVFYDMAQQAQILARDLEGFLGPIYKAGASYVVAILGPEYGQRRWTRFESDQFKELFGEERVIPIWSTEALPTAFDVSAGVGGATFDPAQPLEHQAKAIADLLSRKLEDAGTQGSLLAGGS